MDPTTKKKQTISTTTTITAPSPPSPLSDPLTFSTQYRLKAAHHPIHNPSPPSTLSKASDPPRFHSLLHFKSLTLSADAESHYSSLIKRHPHQPKKQQSKGEMEKQKRPIKEKHKIKPSKIAEEATTEEEKKRVSVSLVSGERRRSFCGDAKIELSSFFSGVGARVVAVDMPPFMQIHAVSCARKTYDGLDKLSSKTLASTLKKEFDGVYGPAWHCIVGSSFGSFVTHSVGGFLYFSLDHKLYVLLFKTSVQRAD